LFVEFYFLSSFIVLLSFPLAHVRGKLRTSILTVNPATTTSPKKADDENMLVQLQKLFANLKLSVMKSVDPTAFVKTYRDMV
jgi:hypothetical protein